MNRRSLDLPAASSLAMADAGAAQPAAAAAPNSAGQTADQSAVENSLVPPGLIADRTALTAMDYIEIQQLYAPTP